VAQPVSRFRSHGQRIGNENSKERSINMDPHADRIEGLTAEQLEAEVAEPLPERALMSTVSLSALDPTGDTADAVTDSVVTTAAAAAGDVSPGADPGTATAPAGPADGSAAPVDGPTIDAGSAAAPDHTGAPVDATAGTAAGTADQAPPAASAPSDAAPAIDETVHAVGDAAPAVNDTIGTVGDSAPAVNDTIGTVGDTAPAVDNTIGTVGDNAPAVGDTVDTAGGVVGGAVPEVSDTVDGALPGLNDTADGTLASLLRAFGSTSLLDLDVDLDLALDAAAPLGATVAANANVAAPIDAAVSANLLSPGSISLATADQQALLSQTLVGEAEAVTNQGTSIDQGEQGGTADADAGVQTGVDETAPAIAPPTGDALPAGAGTGDDGDAVAPVSDAVPAVDEPGGAVGETIDDSAPAEVPDRSALLDLDVDLDLDLDVAAPISATIAANANVAAPIDAAVSANLLSPDAVSQATADQDALIRQTLTGEAHATSDQTSSIMQGEGGAAAVADPGGKTGVDEEGTLS
jgi:hypothetical protein